MLQLPLLTQQLSLRQEEGVTKVFDPVRKKWLVLTPEEHVRQLLLLYLLNEMYYPLALISVEKKILINGKAKRFDIVVYSRELHEPWMLIECKSPEVPLTDAALYQLLDYHNHLQCNYWMISNGHSHFCADATNTNAIKWLNALPAYEL